MTREEKNERIIKLLEMLSVIPIEDLREKQEASPPDDLKET